MGKNKALFVTAIMTALAAGLWVCLWKVSGIGFTGMTAFFAAIGFFGAVVNLFHWLAKAPAIPVDKLDLPKLHYDEPLEPISIPSEELTYEQIREEVASL